MSVYPIEGLMNTAMNSIKEMVDVNTIIGEPIQANNNVVIIPISKVNFGFAAGGSEFKGKVQGKQQENMNNLPNDIRMPFGGGSGAGVSISPIAFIVVQQTGVKLLPVEHSSSLDKLLDLVPDLIDKLNSMIDSQLKKMQKPSTNNNSSSNNTTNQNTVPPENTTNININTEPKKYDVEYDETLDM